MNYSRIHLLPEMFHLTNKYYLGNPNNALISEKPILKSLRSEKCTRKKHEGQGFLGFLALQRTECWTSWTKTKSLGLCNVLVQTDFADLLNSWWNWQILTLFLNFALRSKKLSEVFKWKNDPDTLFCFWEK